MTEHDLTDNPITICLGETQNHIAEVSRILTKFSTELRIRAATHDYSKLDEPELELFAKTTPKLKDLEYGSEEYKQALAELKPALDHHYNMNRHHPEHFHNGIKGMTLIDLIEMLSDWMAAVKRHDNGDIYKSLAVNTTRFYLGPQLVALMKNTIEHFKHEGYID